VKFEIERAIGTLKLQSRYNLYSISYLQYSVRIKFLYYILSTIRINLHLIQEKFPVIDISFNEDLFYTIQVFFTLKYILFYKILYKEIT